jgi:hypothetical protein
MKMYTLIFAFSKSGRKVRGGGISMPAVDLRLVFFFIFFFLRFGGTLPLF